MVRVISEKLFSPPRSRHSSGDTVDRELAARAVEALSSLNSRRLEFVSDYESSSDSHWDSEVDVDGDGNGNETRGPSTVGEESSGEADAVQKRKERRRERNKRSAQAYRSRRREHCVKQQTVLQELQQKNGQLKGTVLSLQDQIQHLRRCAVTRPLPPNPTTPSTNTTPTAATATTSTPTPAVDTASCLHHTDGAPVRVSEGGEEGSCGPMDNEANRSRLLSPLLDNFSFTQPSPAASPAASPLLSPSAAASPRFSFPPPPSPGTDSALSQVPPPPLHAPL